MHSAKFTFAELVIAKRLGRARSSANNSSSDPSNTEFFGGLGKEGYDRLGKIADKRHHGEWLGIAESR